MKILSLVKESEDFYIVTLQGIYNEDRRDKFLAMAQEQTLKFIERDMYTHKVNVYEHEGCAFNKKTAKAISYEKI